MKKIEKIDIKAIDYPDFDYVIDRLIDLSEKLNEVVDTVNFLITEEKSLICYKTSHVFDRNIVKDFENFHCVCGRQIGYKAKDSGLIKLPERGRIE